MSISHREYKWGVLGQSRTHACEIARATESFPRDWKSPARANDVIEKIRKIADISENLRKLEKVHACALSSWKSMLVELCFYNKMNVSEMTTSKVNSNSSSVIKMNNQTIRELRAIAKERGLRGYFILRKAELVSLMETPVRPPRRSGQGVNLGRATILPRPGQMDVIEQQEMTKTRSAVKSKLNEWYDWLVDYVPESIKKPVSSVFSEVKNHIMKLYGDVKKRLGLKEQVEELAEKEHDEEHVEGV